jgi:hypothetical protein
MTRVDPMFGVRDHGDLYGRHVVVNNCVAYVDGQT